MNRKETPTDRKYVHSEALNLTFTPENTHLLHTFNSNRRCVYICDAFKVHTFRLVQTGISFKWTCSREEHEDKQDGLTEAGTAQVASHSVINGGLLKVQIRGEKYSDFFLFYSLHRKQVCFSTFVKIRTNKPAVIWVYWKRKYCWVQSFRVVFKMCFKSCKNAEPEPISMHLKWEQAP